MKGQNQAFSQASFLLTKVEELGDASKSDLVETTSYASSRKDGSEQLSFMSFNDAQLEAKGISLEEGGDNGNLLVGKTYTGLLDIKPGDEFEIRQGRKEIELTLKEHQEKAVEAASAEA